jgi:pyrroloquinoline-quinone synthase
VTRAWSAAELEAALHAVGRARYHARHPFHRMLADGALTHGQLQAWALNRYVYQAAIPRKDATLIARCDDAELRRHWRRRLADHDGDAPGEGGLARWLALAEALGLDRATVESQRGALPAVRFAVDSYVRFVAERSLLEAVASSLTELFAPQAMAARVEGMLAHYDVLDRADLAYFTARLSEAPRDADHALAYVRAHATTPALQQAAVDALSFKCDVLWAILDALHHAYVTPGLPPPGAFDPAGGGAGSAP